MPPLVASLTNEKTALFLTLPKEWRRNPQVYQRCAAYQLLGCRFLNRRTPEAATSERLSKGGNEAFIDQQIIDKISACFWADLYRRLITTVFNSAQPDTGYRIPDTRQGIVDGRVSLSESIASATTLFLQSGDLKSIGNNLEFNIRRSPSLLAASLSRQDDEPLFFGDPNLITLDEDVSNPSSTTTRIVLPILREDAVWGNVILYFSNVSGNTLLEKIRSHNSTFIVFCGLFSFIFFYLYLGKMLKALNPSRAIPGRVRSALDTLAEALIVIDQNSNIVLANKAFQEVTGRNTEELIGKRADSFDWQHNDTATTMTDRPEPFVYPWQQAIDSSETIRGVSLSLAGVEGARHDFLVNCSPILSGAKASGVLISLDDVTELEQKERELRVARDEAEQANRAKSDFLSNMSHEIRTPMTAILGFTEVLKRGGTSSPQWDKHLSTIASSGKHLLELINDVLDLSKVESGALEVEAIECEPHRVAHDVVQVLKVRATEKGISLDLKIPEPIPQTIISDSSRLRQIITNMVGNAIKFTEQGGVTIILRYIHTHGRPQIAIDVADSGIGMNQQQQEAVFKPFVQADSSITRRFGGTGLGLSISRKLSHALGGDIVLSSEAGVGTTFTATINANTSENITLINEKDALESLSQRTDREQKHWTFPDSTVLVIDDAAENRELLTIVLQDVGLTVETAENGAIGVNMANDKHYDVVLSDIQMPVMDGYETVKAMRQSGRTQPVIALTANAMKGYEQRVLEAGFSHYMTKPIDIDALTNLLAKLLNGRVSDVAPVPMATKSNQAASNSADDSPIVSRLADSNLAGVIDKFIVRLNEQLPLMQIAIDEGNMAELTALAHWLKGSGGTVGFDSFSNPAKELEELAKNNQVDKVAEKLETIRGLAGRLQHSDGSAKPPANMPTAAPAAQTSTMQTAVQTAVQTAPPTAVQTAANSVFNTTPIQANDDSADANVARSRLAADPKFRPIVLKFLPRLHEKLSLMAVASETGDYETLAELAHWLKGSGGMLGYDAFTSMAADLERSARDKNGDAVAKDLAQIVKYSGQLVTPGNDGEYPSATNNAV